MYDINEFNDIISKIKTMDYDYLRNIIKFFNIRIGHLRSENDNAERDEVLRNQGGIKELNYILNVLTKRSVE